MFVKVNSAVKSVTPFAKVNGAVKPIKAAWCKVGDQVMKIWPAIESGLTGEYGLVATQTFSGHNTIGVLLQCSPDNYTFLSSEDDNFFRLLELNTNLTISHRNQFRQDTLSGFSVNHLPGVNVFHGSNEIQGYISHTFRLSNERHRFHRNLGHISRTLLNRPSDGTIVAWITGAVWTKFGVMYTQRNAVNDRFRVVYPSGTTTTNVTADYTVLQLNSRIAVSPCGEYAAFHQNNAFTFVRLNASGQTTIGIVSTTGTIRAALFTNDGNHFMFHGDSYSAPVFRTYKTGLTTVVKDTVNVSWASHRGLSFKRDGRDYLLMLRGLTSPDRTNVLLYEIRESGIYSISDVTISGVRFMVSTTSITHDGKYLINRTSNTYRIYEIR